MIEASTHPREARKAHIERDWEARHEDARRYGEVFAGRFQPTVQEALGGLQTLTTTLHIEHIDEYTDAARELVGGDSAFVLECIERPSYLHGLMGFPEWPAVDPASRIDLDLSIEALENEARPAPYPDREVTGSLWRYQFTRSQLAKLAAYWYGIGAVDRLTDSVESRRLSELSDQLAEKKMGPFDSRSPHDRESAIDPAEGLDEDAINRYEDDYDYDDDDGI